MCERWIHLGFRVNTQSLSHIWLFSTPWAVYSPLGSSVHGILQRRVLEWVVSIWAHPPTRDRTHVSCIGFRVSQSNFLSILLGLFFVLKLQLWSYGALFSIFSRQIPQATANTIRMNPCISLVFQCYFSHISFFKQSICIGISCSKYSK